jgi:hypothetical protein
LFSSFSGTGGGTEEIPCEEYSDSQNVYPRGGYDKNFKMPSLHFFCFLSQSEMASRFLTDAEIAARIYHEEEDPPPIEEEDGGGKFSFYFQSEFENM